jgi:predicted nucleotidyltransferase
MDEKIIKHKIEKSLEIICPLYKEILITDAYIVGSVARGTAKKESDIDIMIINPIFAEWRLGEFPPSPKIIPSSISEKTKRVELFRASIVNLLTSIGVEFKEINYKGALLWFQLYKGELFHISTSSEPPEKEASIKIDKDLCSI